MEIQTINQKDKTYYSLCDFAVELGWKTNSGGKVYPHQTRIKKACESTNITPIKLEGRHYITKDQMIELMSLSKSENVIRIKKWLGEVKTYTDDFEVFSNEEFGNIRVKTIDNITWFVLADVCKILDLNNTSKVKNRLILDGVTEIQGVQNNQITTLTLINEPNLYKCIFQSTKPNAVKFTNWVTSEVLPAIRKHGAYITGDTIDNILTDPDFGIRLLNELKKEREEKQKLQKENHQLEESNQSLNTENKILAQEVLTWADRDKLNKGIRTLALTAKIHYGNMWNELYRELKYKHHIDLKIRGKKTPYIQYVKESEWKAVMSTFAAMCREYGTTVEKMIKDPPNIKSA